MTQSVKGKMPEGPKGSLILGSTPAFAANALQFISDCQYTYKDIAYAKIAFKDFYLLFKPSLIQHVLQMNYRNYKKSFAYKGFQYMLGNGLLTSEGDFWLKQRRLAQPAFHRERLGALVSEMNKATAEMLSDLSRFEGEYVSMNEVLRKVSEEIVTRSLFSTSVQSRSINLDWILEHLRNFENEKVKNPFMLPLYVPTRRNGDFKKALNDLDSIIYRIIDQRQSSLQVHHDLLAMLMEVKDEDTGEKMSRKQLRDEVATIFIAGQETTAKALGFILYLLSIHPEVERKLREEVGAVLQGKEPVMEDLGKMPYLLQVLKESMRLYPPAWAVSREAVKEDEAEGYMIRKGATIFLSIYAMHRHPDYWDRPDEFDPERFSQENFGARQKEAYMPFGTGARICIGNNFAMMEMQLIVARMIQQYSFSLDPGFDPKLIVPITLSFKNVLRMKVVKR